MGESSESGIAEADRAGGESAVVLAGRHRQHRFPAREHTVKARYDGQELAVVQQAAGAAGMRAGGYVASAALRMAQQMLEKDVGELGQAAAGGGPGRSGLVTDREDQELLTELIQARLALRRYGVNINQAAMVLNSGGQMPVWLQQAVAGGDRAVARVDQAAAAVARRLG